MEKEEKNKKREIYYKKIIYFIIHSKYFPYSDWLKANKIWKMTSKVQRYREDLRTRLSSFGCEKKKAEHSAEHFTRFMTIYCLKT